MASVGDIGREFHLSTKQVLCRLLEDFENLAKELFDTVAKGYMQRGSKVNVTEAITKLVDKLVKKDAQLQSCLLIAIQQLEKHKRMKQIRDEIMKKEQDILQLQTQLKEAESVLATALFQAKQKLEATEEARKASMSCEDLIKFAFRISSGNSAEAPPDWLPGDPRRPYPLDIEMRCGALGQLSQQKTVIQGGSNSTEPNTKTEVCSEEKDRNLLDREDSMAASLSSRNDSVSSRNGGIWHGPPSEDVAHLATMPVSAMMSHSTNGLSTVEEVEFMSTSSDSSSSGESG